MGNKQSNQNSSKLKCTDNLGANQTSKGQTLIKNSGIDPERHEDVLLDIANVSSPKFVIIKGERSTDEVINVLSSTCDAISAVRETPNHQQVLLLYKFNCIEELSADNLQQLNLILKNVSAVLIFESQSEGRTTIYWKSNEIEELLKLKHYKKFIFNEERKLSEFVADFLARSLKNNHLGTVNQFSFHHDLKPLDLELVADSRDYNLLLLAAEQGNTEMVEILLKLDMNTTSQDSKIDAQTLAMERQHFDVLHVMLLNNLRFPTSFVASNCTGSLKQFCKVTEEVHSLIKSNKKEKLAKILNQHKNLRHFYNFSNESALKVAIESKSFEAFDLLLSKKFRFGSHENPAEYFEELDIESKQTIRDIQNKYAQSFLEKHIHTLVLNSKACYDETEADDKLIHVQRAFKLLNENPLIRIILMIVAASRNFKIVFDFNREAVNILDPTTNDSTRGIFYLSGKIFIGAKQLLNPETVNETLAFLIHELCHYTMNLLYKNHAKPYKKDDIKTIGEFEKISNNYKARLETEIVVDSVFKCYPEEDHHAELIVRVVHLLALYRDLPDLIAEKRKNFIELFEFYEKKIVPELNQALPDIKGSDKKELIKKDKKISKLRKISIIGGILSVVGILAAIVIAVVLYTPIYKFDELSVENRQLIFDAPINYKNTINKLRELFPKNSTVLKNLTSSHISKMLNGKVLDFDDSHLAYLNNHVEHNWRNLTEKLKQKFLKSNFTFQNESIKFEDLYELNSQIFDSLSHQQILNVFNGKMLVVHEMIKSEAMFYFERKFWDANILEIYFDFMTFAVGETLFVCSAWNKTKSNKTFETFYFEHKALPITTQMDKINNIRQNLGYKECTFADFEILQYNSENEIDEILSHKTFQFDFNKILNLANSTKLFILSNEAGAGKTITFESFTEKIKKIYPTKWVSYIDLKDFKEYYSKIKTLEDVKEMLKKIFKVSSQNKFEMKIFDEFFDSGNLILLWNGFDEISPDFSESVIKILTLIRENTQNIQFVCTRPLYVDLLKLSSDDQAYSLIPFDKNDQEEYVKSFLQSHSKDDSNITDYIQKVQNIINSIESNDDFNTPLMLGMIAELVDDDEIYKSENIYQIYQKFVEKKIAIWQIKSEFGRNFSLRAFTDTSGFSIIKLYQSYAIKNEITWKNLAYLYLLKLNVMRQVIPEKLTNHEISRMGILYINDKKSFKFGHRTFVEFFIAQYLIENIYDTKIEITDEEAELVVALFMDMLKNDGIKRFINSYLKTETKSSPFVPKIANVFKTKFRHFLLTIFVYESDENFNTLLNFIKKDPEVVKSLLYVNENQTLYAQLLTYKQIVYGVEVINKIRFPTKKFDIIKSFANFTLSENDYKKFINVKNQKGIIEFSSYCFYQNFHQNVIIHEDYQLDQKLLNNENSLYVFELIVKNLTKNEFKILLESGVIYHKFYDKISNSTFNNQIWTLIENEFQEKEQKEIFKNIFKNIQSTESLNFRNMMKKHIEFMGSKMERIFTKIEIIDLVTKDDILFKMVDRELFNVENFEAFQWTWSLIVNYTTWDEQKIILKQKRNCLVEICHHFCLLFNQFMYDIPPKIIQNIYDEYFNKTEIQEIIKTHSNDFLMYFTSYRFAYLGHLVEYLQETFIGNEKTLHTFLLQKIEPSDKNIFDWSKYYNFDEENVKILSDLLHNITLTIEQNKTTVIP